MTAATPHTAPHAEWLTLQGGDARLEWLPAGTTLLVLAGSLTLEHPPRWLAGEAHQIRHTLTEGHAHVLETSGWWGLHADRRGGAQLRVLVPAVAAPRRPWLAPLRRWLALFGGQDRTSRASRGQA